MRTVSSVQNFRVFSFCNDNLCFCVILKILCLLLLLYYLDVEIRVVFWSANNGILKKMKSQSDDYATNEQNKFDFKCGNKSYPGI